MQLLFPWLAQACSATPLLALCKALRLNERSLAPWRMHTHAHIDARRCVGCPERQHAASSA